MTWKKRKKKAFDRMICRLKEAPIYIVDKYILIDEHACYVTKYGKSFNYKHDNIREYKKHRELIKSAFDFDEHFNPDLTLYLPFEKNLKTHNDIAQKLLLEIGNRWKERLSMMFPKQNYTIVQYYDQDSADWYLDFYNGERNIQDFSEEERIKNVIHIV